MACLLTALAAGTLLLVISCSTDAGPGTDEIISTEDSPPVVHTSYGPVQGLKFMSLWTRKVIYSFRGIPYASPPVGDLRFKEPVPPQKWTSIRNCTEDQPVCPQSQSIFEDNNSLNMSEECLFVNVYTPQVKTEDELLPVIVWVHGGGFIEGSGSYPSCGPDFLVGEDVVVVTFNYRLGALGFLTMGTADIPGNAGLKDQWFALKWVQEEIHQFGGDAAKVTLFGESAGSASVHLHYLSPLSKGLFHRVIGDSGTGLTNWAVRDNGAEYGLQLAQILNCSTADIDTAQKCMMAADNEAIVKAQQLVKASDEDRRNGAALIFIPTIDGNTSAMPFLPDFPTKLLEQKQGSFVPFMMGINSDEGMMRLGKSEEEIKNITNNLEYFIPVEVRNSSTQSRLHQLTERIKQFYFKDTIPSFTNLRGYVDLYTDVMFGYSTAVSARSYRDRADVYLYYFSFNGTFKESIVKYIEQKLNFSGVSHAEELSYLFVRQQVNQTAAKDSNEMKTWKRMARLWTNFAKFGTPTIGLDPDLQNVTWSPVGNVTTKYLHIDVNLTMVENDFLGSRVALWDSVTASNSLYLEATGLVFLTSSILYMTK